MPKVAVIGPGTIGEQVAYMLLGTRRVLGVDDVIVYKRTPEVRDVSKVKGLVDEGALLAVEEAQMDAFRALGLRPTMTRPEALAEASIVFDCSGAGVEHITGERKGKSGTVEPVERWYDGFLTPGHNLFVQGSDEIGQPTALGINDEQSGPGVHQIEEVVSCNTHGILALTRAMQVQLETEILNARFTMLRRGTDMGAGRNVDSPTAEKAKYGRHGSHHAHDADRLLQTMGVNLDLHSIAVKLPTQAAHLITFSYRVVKPPELSGVVQAFENRPLVGLTRMSNTHEVFTRGRSIGYRGRFLHQVIVLVDTLEVVGDEIHGVAMVVQESNSLLTDFGRAFDTVHGEGGLQAALSHFGQYCPKWI